MTPAPMSSSLPSRQTERETLYASENYQTLRQRYPVDIKTTTLANIPVEIFTPAEGIAPENQHNILINFHGGSFQTGSRTCSQLESIPMAALGKIKVISVDYRLYPEHHYPAATDDAQAVYQHLFQHHRPENIALFGSSAGAQLIAQLLVRLQDQDLPPPAAVAMIAEGATQHNVGDSITHNGQPIAERAGLRLEEIIAMPYFEQADQNDPRLCPSLSDALMAKFPPTLLASSSRDIWLSPVINTHRQLHRLGVKTELHIWDGLEHCFHYDPKLPASRELHEAVLGFLLGRIKEG